MATTLTINDAAIFAQTLLKGQRLMVNNQQPALVIGNIVLQRMLAAPFVWRFNRFNFTLSITTAGGTDYVASLPSLGFIEDQWLVKASDQRIIELGGSVSMARSTGQRRPKLVAPQYDDNAGNITFRFDSVPDTAYTAGFDAQKKAPLLTSVAQNFGSTPDEFAYLFMKGFLAEAALLNNDSRFPIWQREFVGGLLYTQDGLDSQAKSIYLEQMLASGRTSQRSQMAGQLGNAARAQ